MSVKDNVRQLLAGIPKGVTVVAAVKYASPGQIAELVQAGITDLGFNTYQQLSEVRPSLPKSARIHFIGHLQANKARKVVEGGVFLIQSVDSLRLAEKIDDSAGRLGIKQEILLQVRTDNNKEHGVPPDDIKGIVMKIEAMPNLNLKGLMTIPPVSDDPSDSRKPFAMMKSISASLSADIGRDLEFLSMGMSGDYNIAIEEGANMVRIGRKLFT